MELLEPRAKKGCKLTKNLPFPVIFKKDKSIKKIVGRYNGYSVVIEDLEDMKNVVSMGYFGKANFSRSYPQSHEKNSEIIRKRQFNRRKLLSEKFQSKVPHTVIVVPDSDDDNEEYFVNLRPAYEVDRSGVKEKVWMSMEEAFFLAHGLNCLDVYQDKLLEIPELWDSFSKSNPHFVYNYVAYYHFRAKNWVVKPGIKFGGDFLLYKQGPPFYHASYVVIIDILNPKLQRRENLTRRSMDNVSLLALNRLCEAAGKELLICQVVVPDDDINYQNLGKVEVKEIGMRRWVMKDNM